MKGSPAEAAGLALELCSAKEATLGGGRLICIDGPGGSGKSTLAAAIASKRSATVVAMDDLYDGWSGLRHVTDQLTSLLTPLSRREPGTYRRYDWEARAYAETVSVAPASLLVLEGVGSGAASFDELVTVLIWVCAPPDVRLQRGLERDGVHLRDQWLQWMRDEDELFARERPDARADLVVDGTGATPPRLNG